MKKDLGLYLHVPFCVKKCNYCDFLSKEATEEEKEAYVDALIKEIKSYKKFAGNYKVSTVFVGGGTPSCLRAEQTKRIFDALYEIFEFVKHPEITTEMNPGTVDREKLEVYKACGINRLSIGMQSVKDENLKVLGRIHNFEQLLEAYQLAREAGFTNINLDLMSSLPSQTKEEWEEELQKTVELNPEHISAYQLIIEEGTPFYEKYDAHPELLPNEEESRAIYQTTKRILEANGYMQYEISNYAKPQKKCKHNLRYWERGEYLGIGLGSASLIQNMRMNNTREMSEYLEKSAVPKEMRKDVEFLENRQQIEEFMFLGLRKTYGVSKKEFHRAFGRELEDVYGQTLKKFIEEGMIKEKKDRIFLTEDGVLVSNQILSEFLF